MTVRPSFPRTLWFDQDGNRQELSQSDVASLTGPIVVLGEAGMGKTHLLEWLANSKGTVFCTARKLLNRHDPRTLVPEGHTVIIDGLDEVSTQQEGDSVNQVLRQLGAVGYPPFVLSCRAVDWRSASGGQAIQEQYSQPVHVLHLMPIEKMDALRFLASDLGNESAVRAIDHFNSAGLSSLLGNPQTLGLIGEVAAKGALPNSRAELFDQATDLLERELRKSGDEHRPPQGAVIDAAGAAFAALILTDAEALTRRPSRAEGDDADIAVKEIAALPDGQHVRAAIDSRLFRTRGPDRFTYVHRRIGEFLGARWIAKCANSKQARRRVLAMLHSHGLVPASLRGIHAWLARDPEFARQVINADPLGVIEYGDADNLTVDQARTLLRALARLASNNPYFMGWGTYSLKGIAQPALLGEIREIISNADVPFSLRRLVLQAIHGTPLTQSLVDDLRRLLLTPEREFANRRAAGDALIELGQGVSWREVFSKLIRQRDQLSARLAVELIAKLGPSNVDPRQVARAAVEFARRDERTIGVLGSLQRSMPADILSEVLDRIGVAIRKPSTLGFTARNELTDFVYDLIVRRLEIGNAPAEKLWQWLKPLDFNMGYNRKPRVRLGEILAHAIAAFSDLPPRSSL